MKFYKCQGDNYMKHRKFTVIGGDLRNIKLANFLVEDGHEVKIYGFDKADFELGITSREGIEEAIHESDIIIGPLPCSNNGEILNSPFSSNIIYINDIFKLISKKQLFIAGFISDKILKLADLYDIQAVDILAREEMAVMNAIPTAEGAIQIAMEELPITIHASNTLVLGYGRIGKILSKMLDGIGANVYVEARKFSDLALIRSCGYNAVHISELPEYLCKMDIIFNTIPFIILNDELLKTIKSTCLIIDLASKPGGIDFNRARESGIKAIWALSLPGRVAPLTAAEFIKETVYNILEEMGV
jgi:dipicolinate synthase subunit A